MLEQYENTLIVIVGVFSMMVLIYIFYHEDNIDKKELLKKLKKPKPLQDVKIVNDRGELLQGYDEVYVEHWDRSIYNIYDKKDGEFITTLHVGASMLLTISNTTLKGEE